MNNQTKVAEKIAELRRERAEFDREKREKILEKLDFYDKVYFPSRQDIPPEYDRFEIGNDWDEEKNPRWFVKVPLEVSDEEFREILEITNADSGSLEHESNFAASVLRIIAVVIYVIFGLFGLAAIFSDFVVGAAALASGFVVGTVFLGFSEIIALIHKINRKLK